MCCPTDEEAQRKADGWTFFAFALRYYGTHVPGAEGPPTTSGRSTRRSGARRSSRRCTPAGSSAHRRRSAAKLRKFEASHVDQVILLNQAGRNTHEDICASLELFAEEVMPEFVERDGEHQAWKQAVLAGDIELEEVDVSPEAVGRPVRAPIS